MWRGVSPETGLAAGGERALTRFAPLAAIHLTALAILLSSETEWHARVAFLLTWGSLNFFWMGLLLRPSAAAAPSLPLPVPLAGFAAPTGGRRSRTIQKKLRCPQVSRKATRACHSVSDESSIASAVRWMAARGANLVSARSPPAARPVSGDTPRNMADSPPSQCPAS